MDLCRICFENLGTTDLFDTTRGVSISSKIMHCCANIRIYKEDGLPVRVCSTCEMESLLAYKFVIKCEEADKRLHSLGDLYFYKDDVKVEVKLEEESQADNSDNYEHYNNTTLRPQQIEDSPMEIQDTTPNVTKIETSETVVQKSKIHKASVPPHCKECGKECQSQSALIIHMRTHSDERPYGCQSCHKRYKDKSSLRRHNERNHNKERKRNVICELCGKAFFSYAEVKTHMRTHTGETPYICSSCPAKFTQVGALLRHRLRHTGEKAHTCLKCTKKFHTKVELTKHEMVHTDVKEFVCMICNVQFKYANNLRKHILQHSLANNFICDYCGRTFKAKGNLKIHINSIHSRKSGYCHVCSKNVPNVEIHMWRHTGQRPLKCDLCSRSFFEKKALTRHINFSHIQNDKYKCTVDGCTSTFPSHPMLEYHVAKLHGSSVPFPCDTCCKGFYRRNDLTRHKLRNHKEVLMY